MRSFLAGGALALAALAGAGCSFQPRIGMSFEEWNRQCRSQTLAGGTLLEQQGSTAVYFCETRDVLYTFVDGGLASIKQEPVDGSRERFRVGR